MLEILSVSFHRYGHPRRAGIIIDQSTDLTVDQMHALNNNVPAHIPGNADDVLVDFHHLAFQPFSIRYGSGNISFPALSPDYFVFVAQKANVLFPDIRNQCFFHRKRQPHFLFKKLADLLLPEQRMLPAVCDNHEVIRISDQYAGDQIAAFPQRRHFGALIPIRSVNLFIDPLLRDKFVQHIQIYVCKQRRQDATLRCSFLVDLALIHNTSLEHLLDDLQQSPILDAHMIQAFQEDAVIDPVKAFGNITFHDPMPSILVYRPNDSLQGHFCVAHRTESIGVLIELSLHNGFQNDSHTFLHNSISYGRYSQRPFFLFARLINVLSSDEFRYIVCKSTLDIVNDPFFSALQIVSDFHAIHARRICTLVGLDIVDCGYDCRLCRHDLNESLEGRAFTSVIHQP